MFKKIIVTGAVLAAAGGAALAATPAHADSWTGNGSWNRHSIQSGNNFGRIAATNLGGSRATNVNTINGVSITVTNGARAGLYHRSN